MAASRPLASLLTCTSLLLCFASCIPEFSAPLSDEKTSQADAAFLGRWVAVDGTQVDETGTIFIAGRGDHAMRLFEVGYDETGSWGVELKNLLVTKVGELRIVSWPIGEASSSAENSTGYGLYLCEFSDAATLRVYMTDEQPFGAAIAARQLKGKVRVDALASLGARKTIYSETSVTDSAEAVRQVIARHGKVCFYMDEPILTLKRVPASAK